MFLSQSQRPEDLSAVQTRRDQDTPAKTATLPRAPRVLLVGIGFGAPSHRALRRADALGQALGLELRLVHATAEAAPTALPLPQLVERQLAEVPGWEERMQSTVQAWAVMLAGVMVPTSQICIGRGDPASVLLREAARPDVEMVLIGSEERSEAELRPAVARKLLRICPCPMLVVKPRGLQPVIVAATDCSDGRFPVVQSALRIAPAVGQRVVAVHNMDSTVSRSMTGLGLPVSPQLDSLLRNQVQERLEQSAGVQKAVVSGHAENARGVLAVARSQQADLLVVGVKNQLAAAQDTAETILDESRCSVLFVPLGRSILATNEECRPARP